MSYTCSKCGSENIQSFRLAYENGTASTVTSSNSVGVGLAGGNIGVAGAHTVHHSVSATQLAQRVAPPETQTPKMLWGGLGMVLILLGSFHWMLSVLGIAALIYWGFKASQVKQFNFEVHPRLMAEWECSWICHKCGHTFIIDDGSIAAVVASIKPLPKPPAVRLYNFVSGLVKPKGDRGSC